MPRKYFSIIILLVVLGLSCDRNKAPPNIPNETRTQKDMASVLFDEEFHIGASFYSLILKFRKDKSFELAYDSEGWYWYNKGTFDLKDDTVRLKSSYCGENSEMPTSCAKTFNNGHCKLATATDSIEFLYEIVCIADKKFVIFFQADEKTNTIRIPVRKYKIPAGTNLKFNGFEVVAMANVQGRVSEPVVLRTGPGLTYEKCKYTINDYEDEVLESIAKGTKVTVHARTLKKTKIKSWENYWYLITVGESEKVWVFAEFIGL